MDEKSATRKVLRRMKIDQWTPGIRVTWTPESVQAALIQHQQGNFAESSRLVEAMWQDDELPTAMEMSNSFIVGADFELSPETKGDEPVPGSEALAEQIGPFWDESFPRHEVGKLLQWFQMLGVAVGTLDWHRDGAMWKPKLRVLHPEFLYFDESELNPQTGLYGVFKYHARGGTQTVTPGDGKWVLLSDGRESWMRCSVRALATTWLIKQLTLRDWARYNERHGLPIVKAMFPAFADGPDKVAFASDVSSLGSDTTVNLPSYMDDNGAGFDLDLVEAKDQAWETFQATINRCDRKFQVHFLGTNTNELIGTAGSRATSESGRSISMQKAQERVNRVCSDVREQMVMPIISVNRLGDTGLTPWPHWMVEGDKDLGERALGVKAFAEALVQLKTAGYKVSNIEEEAAQYGLQLEEAEEPEDENIDPTQGEEDDEDDVGPNGRSAEGSGEELDGVSGGCSHNHALLEGVDVSEVGSRDGLVSSQRYLDGLTDALSTEAATVEEVDAEAMLSLIDSASGPEDLRESLAEYLETDDPILLGRVFEKAILLSELAGRFAVQEDL